MSVGNVADGRVLVLLRISMKCKSNVDVRQITEALSCLFCT